MNQDEITARLQAMSPEQQADEITRQGEILAAAIGFAISDAMSSFEVPLGNAVLSALVAAEAQFLAILSEDDRRASMRRMERMRPKAIATAVQAERGRPKVQTIRRFDA